MHALTQLPTIVTDAVITRRVESHFSELVHSIQSPGGYSGATFQPKKDNVHIYLPTYIYTVAAVGNVLYCTSYACYMPAVWLSTCKKALTILCPEASAKGNKTKREGF